MHIKTQVNKYTTNTDLPHLPLIRSKTMRTECTALCIVLVIMSSTLSSCYPSKYITSFVPTMIPLKHDYVFNPLILLPWMHAALVLNFHLHRCTEARCQTKCLDYANKYHLGVKNSQCYKANLCHCECSAKNHLPHTTEIMGLADAEDDNG
jgi:hypothetical protein